MQMISKRSSGIKLVEEPSFFIHSLKFQNPPLNFACDIFERHLHKVSEYDQEISQSHTIDKPMAPGGRATEHL